jgi:hypothetical protein
MLDAENASADPDIHGSAGEDIIVPLPVKPTVSFESTDHPDDDNV